MSRARKIDTPQTLTIPKAATHLELPKVSFGPVCAISRQENLLSGLAA